MIKQFKISHPAFNVETTHTLQRESDKFRLHTASYNKHIRNTVKSLLKALRPARNRDIKHWFTRQLKKIAIGVTPSSTNQLHLARKRIKNLIYVHGVLHKRLVARLKLNITYLDQLQDAIGKWHDTAEAVKLLVPRNTGNKANVNRLQKEQDKTGAAIRVISDDFWGKVVQARF